MLFLPVAPCKDQEASPQRTQSPQRGGSAGVMERWGWILLQGHHVKGNVLIRVTVTGSLPAESSRLL